MAAVFREFGEGFYGYFDSESGAYLGVTEPVSPAINPQVPPPPPPPPPASQVDRAPAPVPAPSSSSVGTVGDQTFATGSEEWQVQEQLKRITDPRQLQAWLAINASSFSVDTLSRASGYNAADIQAAITKADQEYLGPRTIDPALANQYSTGQLVDVKGFKIPAPVAFSKEGNPLYARDDPARFQAEAIIDAQRRLDFDRALKEAIRSTGSDPDNSGFYLNSNFSLQTGNPTIGGIDVSSFFKEYREKYGSINDSFDERQAKTIQIGNLPLALNAGVRSDQIDTLYSPGGTQQFGGLTLPKPARVDTEGNPIYLSNDPAFLQAQQLVAAESRTAVERAAKDLGLPTGSVLRTVPGKTPGEFFLEANGKSYNISSYLKDIPTLQNFDLEIARPTTTVETGYFGRQVTITPPLNQDVALRLPNGQNIVVNKDSEVARWIQWSSSSPNGLFFETNSILNAKDGITDPYSNPSIVARAIESIEAAKRRASYLEQRGVVAGEDTFQWNDPNWPAYLGTNKQTFDQATRALADPEYATQLMIQEGWDKEQLDGFLLYTLNPEKAKALAEERDRLAGVVVGPGSTSGPGIITLGSNQSNYVVSSNKATVVEIQSGSYANGTPITKVSAVSTQDPLNPNFLGDRYASTTETQQFGRFVLPKPAAVDEKGNPIYGSSDPALVQARNIVSGEIKAAWDKAVREIYAENGLEFPSIISSMPGPNGWPDLVLPPLNGKIRTVSTDKYFAGIPQIIENPFFLNRDRPVEIFATGFADRQVQITPSLKQSVTTQLPNGQNVVIDPNSELARAIQYFGTLNDTQFGVPHAARWAQRGISDPYSDPQVVQQVSDYVSRVKARRDALIAQGITPEPLFWDDPNWPAYVGTTKEAFQDAVRAEQDPVFKNKLIASQGWDEATYQAWRLSILNPEEKRRLDDIAFANAGFVVGGSTRPGEGTSVYSVSPNQASVIETSNNQFYANGTPISSVTTSAGAVAKPIDPNDFITIPSVSDVLPALPASISGFASAGASLAAAADLIGSAIKSPTALPDSFNPFVTAATSTFDAAVNTGLTTVENLFSGQAATLLLAKNQATLQSRYNQAAGSDWRVRLQLAPGADYLYKDAEPGILAPLFDTDGVIFPYMPSIETSYAASYDKYDLTHSNYRGYFYKGSAVNDINIRATFTAQDTQEANYLLAVIHFFRSVTKMFYGQDSYRGAPPPLTFLSGLGNYQFNNHPCFVASFSYSLPNDVDYIRAIAPNNYGNLFSQRSRTGSTSGGVLGATATRLLGLGVPTVDPTLPSPPAPRYLNNNVNNLDDATYVPTKMEINIALLPTNTRAQVSQQFSLKAFANGNLLKGGFW